MTGLEGVLSSDPERQVGGGLSLSSPCRNHDQAKKGLIKASPVAFIQSFHANHHQFSLDRQRRVGRDVINSTASIDLSKYLADTPIAKQAIA